MYNEVGLGEGVAEKIQGDRVRSLIDQGGDMSKETKKTAHLVSHVHPGGETVTVVFATDADEITKLYPSLRVIGEPPPWVDEEMMATMISKAHDVDNPETWLPDFINPSACPNSDFGIVQIS